VASVDSTWLRDFARGSSRRRHPLAPGHCASGTAAGLALRPWLTGEASPVRAYVNVVTDGFILFIVGFYIARAIEMFLRGRALLASVGK
jgi:hypothetical protein